MTADSPGLDIRPMALDDLRLTLSWAKAEGWNPGSDDAEPFLAADPAGFLMAWLGDEPIASISAVAYGTTFGFIGLYICRPQYRGRGHGKALWNHAMARLDGRTVGLDGVVAQVPNYRRSGFAEAYRNLRFAGRPDFDEPEDPRLVAIDAPLAAAIADFDAAFFPAPRQAFAEAWATPAPTRQGLALVEDGAVAAYGVIRGCAEGHKIGPLFARTVTDADVLFRGLAALRPRGAIVIDVPDRNTGGVSLVEGHGLTTTFETARMYRGPAPYLPLSTIFGSTTLELG